MAATECGHGHIYDSDIYASCPYCNSTQPIINFDSGRAGGGFAPAAYSEDKTAPLDGGYGPSAHIPADNPVVADNVTRPPKGYRPAVERRVDEDQHTVGIMQQKMGLEPVVGWLVCIEGKDKGKDYKLWGRINTVGRSEKMDVCIKGDPSISKEDHARVGYDPKNNRFRVIPASSTNNIYLNDDVIDIPTRLNPYDVLEFGETKLVFIPLCSSRFNWEDGLTGSGDGKE